MAIFAGTIAASADALLDASTKHYLTSGNFNGTPVRLIEADDATKRLLVHELLEQGRLSLNLGDRHPNPYIQAFSPEPVTEQLRKLAEADLEHACVYPTKNHLANVIDTRAYDGRPYTLALALGDPQLDCRFFDLKVLEHYRNDPRYAYHTEGPPPHPGAR